jgi:membrane protease YdiL (CAAX protease family)
MLFSIPVINFLAMWNEGLHFPQFLADVEQWMRTSEAKSAAIIEYFLVMNSYTDLVINLVVIALIPAIGEELLFRGVIQRQITKWRNNHHLAIWVSAFLFSALHIQFLGFIPRFLIGAFFGYLFVWSGSIWLPIITHFFNNALAVILYFKSPLSLDMETIGAQEDQLSLVLLCFLAVCLLLYLLYQHCGQKKSPPVEEGI